MSICSTIPYTDEDYPRMCLYALESAHAKIFGEKSPHSNRHIDSLEGLFTLLENMRNNTPFRPDKDANNFIPRINPFKHRTPVWCAIDSVLENHFKYHLVTQNFPTRVDRVVWFQNLLKMCAKYEDFNNLLKPFVDGCSKMGIEVSIDAFCPQVSIITKEVGMEAHLTAKKIIPKMLEAVEKISKIPVV